MTDTQQPMALADAHEAPMVFDADAFKAAVAASVAEQMALMKAEFAETIAKVATGTVASAPGAEGSNDVRSLLSELTVALLGVSGDGNGHKVIPPKEADKRKAAQKRMGDLVLRIHQDHSLKPHYEVVARTQLQGQVIEPWSPGDNGKFVRTKIIWRGAPNTAMRPLNDIAVEIYGAFLESIGGTTRDQSGVRDMPAWMGLNGLTMATTIPSTMAAHGHSMDAPEPLELSDLLPVNSVTSSVDDPNAELIPMLGTIAEPARRTAPGQQPKLQFPQH